ncbi:MAG: FAD-dependent oxidoreductase [Aliidongia sp.]
MPARTGVLRPESVAAAGWEETETDIDVHALHQGFLRGAKVQGAQLVTNARIDAIERRAGAWHLAAGAARFEARVLVIAAGAWAEIIGTMAAPCRSVSCRAAAPQS